MGGDAGERKYRPGLWMIQFTASDGQQARQYARRGAAREGPWRSRRPDGMPSRPSGHIGR